MKNGGLMFEQLDELLKPGYLELETGYTQMPDGKLFVAALTRMPGSKGKMVEWWLGTYLKDTETYRNWDPKYHLYYKWENDWKPGEYLGKRHHLEAVIAGKVSKITIKMEDPAEYFDVSKFKAGNIGAAFCVQGFLADGTQDARVIHLVRDTDYGCEVRSRLWINGGFEEIARGHLEMSLSEMGNLADILPGIYAREHAKHSLVKSRK